MDDTLLFAAAWIVGAPVYLALGALTSGLLAQICVPYKGLAHGDDTFSAVATGFWTLLWPLPALLLLVFYSGVSVVWAFALVGHCLGQPAARRLAGPLTDEEKKKIEDARNAYETDTL